MKRKIIIFTSIILLLTFGLVYAKDYEITKKSGDYTIQIKIDKNPPVTGLNKMDIVIKDAADQDVTNAKVAVDYGMPAMPGMAAMNYKANADLKGSRYVSHLNFSMSGAWTVNIKINRAGKSQAVKLNVDVQ
jgi:hypothetical protein